MAEQVTKKSNKTDIVDAIVQDVELTVEQVEEATKEAAESAGRALSRVVKRKEEPTSGPLVQDQPFKGPGQ